MGYSNKTMNTISYDYKPVTTSKEGIRRFIMACRLALPSEMKQEDMAQLLGLSRSTFAALLDLGRLPKSNSIPLESYVNMLRLLKPSFPGTETEITEHDLYSLILKEEESQQITSGLALAIEAQLTRNQSREGSRSREECLKEMASRFTGLPSNGIDYDDGEITPEEAIARLEAMLSGTYLPESEIELAILSAMLEKDEQGTHDPLWVRWLCGLMPSTYTP